MSTNQENHDDRPRILILDSGEGSCLAGFDVLSENGFDVEIVGDGRSLVNALVGGLADLVILDVDLTNEDGLGLCRRLTNGGQPVMVCSKAADETDRIIGLELGADDVVSKLTSPREILARIRAILRGRAIAKTRYGRSVVCHYLQGFRYEVATRIVRWPSGEVSGLSDGESAILNALLSRPGYIFSRAELKASTDRDCASDRSVDIRISRLRKKFGREGADIIRAIRKRGYKLAADTADF